MLLPAGSTHGIASGDGCSVIATRPSWWREKAVTTTRRSWITFISTRCVRSWCSRGAGKACWITSSAAWRQGMLWLKASGRAGLRAKRGWRRLDVRTRREGDANGWNGWIGARWKKMQLSAAWLPHRKRWMRVAVICGEAGIGGARLLERGSSSWRSPGCGVIGIDIIARVGSGKRTTQLARSSYWRKDYMQPG